MKRTKSVFLAFICSLAAMCSQAWCITDLPLGQVTTGSITSVAQTNIYTFSANTGDVIDFTVVTTSGSMTPHIQVFTSTGTTPFASAENTFIGCAGGPLELNSVTLPASPGGTYKVWISDCATTNTGDYVIYAQLTNNPASPMNLPLAQTITGTIGSAAQSDTYTFTGNANDVLDFSAITTSGSLIPRFRLYNPDGSLLQSAENTFIGCAGGELEMNTVTLPESGPYTMLFADCNDSNSGNYTMYVQSTIHPAGTVTDVLWGQVQPGTANAASGLIQSNTYAFSGTASDTVYFTVAPTGSLMPRVRIYNPNGSLLTSAENTFIGCAGGTLQINSLKIPTTGNYVLLLDDCNHVNGGNYSFSTECIGVCQLPAPTLTSISPPNIMEGSTGFTLTANGSNYVNVNANSVIQWNGTDLPTTFVNTGQLTAQVPTADIAVAASVPITVYTPSPGGGTSTAINFDVNNPMPAVTSIFPTNTTAGGAVFSLTVNGSNFVQGSQVQWNTNSLSTAYVSATQLTATVPASDIAMAGTASVTVFNSAPAGGTSTPAQTFTINAPPALTAPAPGSTLTASSAMFTWTAGTGISHYQLRIGDTGVGSSNLFASGAISVTYANVTGLPTDGTEVFVRLYYEQGSTWLSTDYTYVASGTPTPPALSSPTPSSKLTGSSANFQWTAGMGINSYQLRIGDTGVGSQDLYASGITTALSENVTGLPTNGGELYVRLYYEAGAGWKYVDYVYVELGNATPPVLNSPTPGSVLTGSSGTFGWTAGAGVTAYQLRIGDTGVGSSDLYASGVLLTNSANVTSLPTTGARLYVRFYYEVDTVWHAIDYLYSESGTFAAPVLTSPTPGSKLTGSSATFSWTTGSEVTLYQLRIGNTGVGSSNLYASGPIQATTANLTGLPTYGGELFVRLYYESNNIWTPIDYTYVEAGTAVSPALTSPTPGTVLTGSSATFDWTAGAGITAYQLRIGTTGIGSDNLYASGVLPGTSANVTGLPTAGTTLNVRLYYEVAGVWYSEDYLYSELGTPTPPALTSPTPGSKLTGSSAMFMWSPGQENTLYQLRIGNTGVGSQNLYTSGVLEGTTSNVTGLPTSGGELFVRLYYETNNVWKLVDYTYVESGTPVAPVLNSPAPGSTLTGSTVEFGWTAGAGITAYQLRIGTTGVGSSNLYASGVISVLEENVTGLPTTGGTIYVRLYYEVAGVWKFSDYTYTAELNS